MTDIAAASEADVVEAVRAARDWKSPLNIVGARTKRNLGRTVASWGTVLDLSNLTGIVFYEPEELILTVKPGTPVAEIEQVLAAKNQRLGFDPADWGPLLGAKPNAATIGGVIAADACGSAAIRYGRARDHLLGFRAVNGFGEAYKAGGKVVKNVTGFDLPKLMCGAFGTLGPLTEVALRVVPKPSLSTTLAVRDLSPADGFAILRCAWSSPLEATGLSYVPRCAGFPELGDIGKGAAIIRLEGAAEPLKEKVAALRPLLGNSEVHEIVGGDAAFRKIGNGAVFAGKALDVWRLIVPPASAQLAIGKSDSALWLGDWAGGVLWIGLDSSAATTNPHDIAAQFGGHAVLIRASEETRADMPIFQSLSADMLALTRSVKAAFDPLGLFNPGRTYEGI
jgi:glycolate oxidase FAD binding subunit